MVRPDLGTEKRRMQRNLGKSTCAEVILNTCISIVHEVGGAGWIKRSTPAVQFSYIMSRSGGEVE